MQLMEENENGDMEFPQGIMLEDCFTNVEQATYGFITNVTLGSETCIENVECTINGTRLNETDRSSAAMQNNTAIGTNSTEEDTGPQSLNDPRTQSNLIPDSINNITIDHAKSKYMRPTERR